jgi:hypothetical protein
VVPVVKEVSVVFVVVMLVAVALMLVAVLLVPVALLVSAAKVVVACAVVVSMQIDSLIQPAVVPTSETVSSQSSLPMHNPFAGLYVNAAAPRPVHSFLT